MLPNDVTEIKPLERRVDTAMYIQSTDGFSYIVVFEAQGKKDAAKRRSWPYYLAYLHERYRCPVLLVVICQDPSTAKWAREPIEIGVGEFTSFAAFPFVLEPKTVPVLSQIDEKDLLLGVLSVITHGREIDKAELRTLAKALWSADAETRTDLATYVQLGLGSLPAASEWRTIMSVNLEMLRKSPILREMLDEKEQEVEARSRAEGKAAALLRILDNRSLLLSGDQRERISTCTDPAQLDAWLDLAIAAATAADLFR